MERLVGSSHSMAGQVVWLPQGACVVSGSPRHRRAGSRWPAAGTAESVVGQGLWPGGLGVFGSCRRLETSSDAFLVTSSFPPQGHRHPLLNSFGASSCLCPLSLAAGKARPVGSDQRVCLPRWEEEYTVRVQLQDRVTELQEVSVAVPTLPLNPSSLH